MTRRAGEGSRPSSPVAPDGPAHEHAWKMTLHLDGCHFYASCYACECGAQFETYDERDVRADSYSAIWMDNEGDEPCKRCEELLAGAEPIHRRTGSEDKA